MTSAKCAKCANPSLLYRVMQLEPIYFCLICWAFQLNVHQRYLNNTPFFQPVLILTFRDIVFFFRKSGDCKYGAFLKDLQKNTLQTLIIIIIIKCQTLVPPSLGLRNFLYYEKQNGGINLKTQTKTNFEKFLPKLVLWGILSGAHLNPESHREVSASFIIFHILKQSSKIICIFT